MSTENTPWGHVARGGGSGFLQCSDGKVRWGLFGAAGIVFLHRSPEGDATVQLQKRSAFAHEGGTWSCAGGAIEPGEDALTAGLREAAEEVGEVPEPTRVIGSYTFAPASDWSYVTSVVEVPTQFGSSVNFETDDVAWFSPDSVERLDLHSGFAAAWPEIRKIIDRKDGSS